jgi:hypothetical protein
MKNLKAILDSLKSAESGLRTEIQSGAGNLDATYASVKSARERVESRLKALTPANAPGAKTPAN